MRRIREAHGWSRSTVVQRMSTTLTQQGLANYESGIRPCPVEMFVAVCQAMNVSAEDALRMIESNLRPVKEVGRK